MEKTLECLAKAYVGESQARNRYTFYAKVAREEGYEQIASIFQETADQEKEHAKNLFKLIKELGGKDIVIETAVPEVFGTTAENLQAAIDGEKYENTTMYPEFADIAEKEGHAQIAARLRAISKAEGHHEERYQKLLNNIVNKTTFEREKEVWWVCRECGYIHHGKVPPAKCPSCDHSMAFFQFKCEEY